jgi:ribosomal-protein-alanine N-acetyltransferase
MLNIIPLQKEHIDSVCEIENESFGDPWKKRFFLDVLENPFSVCFAAEDGAEVAGYLISYHIRDEIQILNVAVKKSMRKKNIATTLFGAVFDYAEAERAERFTLEVRQSNDCALALYKKLGFTVDGIRKNYYKNPKEDAVLMSKIQRRDK